MEDYLPLYETQLADEATCKALDLDEGVDLMVIALPAEPHPSNPPEERSPT